MDVQLFEHKEGREKRKEDIEKRRGFSFWLGIEQKLTNPRRRQGFYRPCMLRSATSFDQSKNSNKSKKNLIGGVMSSDHIR